ncbi:MAG TPA: universal stress protein [Candidatus Dormibacteraeota bacterium]|nr:universal stress protein [Candidatus Dormibacteraeota bacterium]
MGISEVSRATATGRMLLAVEAVPESRAVIAAAAKLARRSHAEVLVLSVRERDYTRGFAWDIHQPGEIAETVSHAIYELQRAGVHARGVIRTARTGRVADEIVYAARRHHADEIVIGASRRSWLGRLLFGSVAPRVLRLSDLPVVAVPTRRFLRASA